MQLGFRYHTIKPAVGGSQLVRNMLLTTQSSVTLYKLVYTQNI